MVTLQAMPICHKVLRDAKYLAIKSDDAQKLYSRFSEMLHLVRLYSKDSQHSDTQRRRHAYYLLRKLHEIISGYRNTGEKEMIRFGNKLYNAADDLFTFVMYPHVPSTNNDTENAIRKCIMHRNIRGQVKSDSGMRMLSVFLTCFETWRINELGVLGQLARYI